MKFYKPGMKARVSGVYEAVHGNSHRLEHELTVSEETLFPVCRHCGHKVRFRLLEPAKHTEQGWVPFGVLFEPFSVSSKNRPERKAA